MKDEKNDKHVPFAIFHYNNNPEKSSGAGMTAANGASMDNARQA